MAFAIGLPLFSTWSVLPGAPQWAETAAREIQAVCRDTGTQWMVVVCLLSYFVTFLILARRLPQRGTGAKGKASTSDANVTVESGSSGCESAPSDAGEELEPTHVGCYSPGVQGSKLRSAEKEKPFALSVLFRGKVGNPDFWLLGFLALVLLRYAVDYANAARSLQVVVLLAGITIGKGAALWVKWEDVRFRHLTPALSPVEAERESHACGFARSVIVLSSLVFLLAASALWQPEMGMEFYYRGIRRWEGVWDNPNTYGLLMGVGVVLAIGLVVSSSRSQVPSCGGGRFWSPVTRHLLRALLFVAAGLCGFGLLKSFSRGAWLATVVGIVLLFWRWINREPRELRVSDSGKVMATKRHRRHKRQTFDISQVRLNWLSVSIILLSSFVICFWQFRHTESPLLRRVFSVGNVNDFSWRNRVTAWQGAGRMMLEKPFVGFGWGKAEEAFRKDYRAARLEETAAIQLNDYLMLGTSAGLPALLCLVIYCALVMRAVTEAERGRKLSTLNVQLPTTAAAGASVLLIGFWFDGGLFKLPTCVVFWMLLELARCSSGGNEAQIQREETEEAGLDDPEILTAKYANHAKTRLAFQWLAGIVAVLAVGQTVLHLGVPQLGVSSRTLSIARHCLVPDREKADFEVLANYPASDWSGKPLKVLLQHAHLASYNRELVNWKLDDSVYRAFVLSPQIHPASDGDRNWRRPLWEYFYPRIRKETSLTAAAETVERQLRGRVKIVSPEDSPKTIAEIWQRERASPQEVEAICVAALRSAGIPARLTALGQAEFWNGTEWELVSKSGL